ncbi:MAG: helicase-related protein, partial [Terriglobia bacterium]
MNIGDLRQNVTLYGPLFPEPVQVIVATQMGDAIKLIGKGVRSNKVYEPILSIDQLAQLHASPAQEPFDGDAAKFRLGVEAMRLGLAYEYDPYFSLSIARVDPLPHQLEAVYDYFIKLPRIRFLLADDPGAGKTIMAGLLIKELKIRGLVKRTLIVTPANLSFQWQRELKDKFRESFEVVRSDVLRANYGMNPWQEKNQVITSVSWVSRFPDAKESLLRSQWDLIIVDEAHKMSASSADKKTLAYQLGESLSQMTDHYLLMTATPHKGDPENFCLFLSLLDKDVYGNIKSLDEAMAKHEAPFYLRRLKEALVSFPDPDTGVVKALFTKRTVQTTPFQISDDELELYDQLTRYVEDQSIKAAREDSARGRAVGFTMAMLQRRFASSIYAVRRTLERMKDKREKVLEDPAKFRQEQIAKRLPEDFEELPDEEQQEIVADLEEAVASFDPGDLQLEISELEKLIRDSKVLEVQEAEVKVRRLKELLTDQGVFADPTMKLLLFTEHKDTLDFLAGDGRNGRPLGKLLQWGLSVTQIHGGMKIGDRDTPGTRIYAEREFRETCQVLVATEAAGEGINLQFCWLMINYDIPWNPVRLEQRMGRIHRYGQEKDCLIFNFVTTNTREGRVLEKLFERISEIEKDLDPKRTGKVFNVLGEIFPANQLEKMLRDMYARNQMTEELIKQRIVEQVDPERFRSITSSTLEGLAKRELNLSAIVGKSAEAKERRLVPEVIEQFFLEAAPITGLEVSEQGKGQHTYRAPRVPRTLWPTGERLEPRFGKLGREYKQFVFDKEILKKLPTFDWVTPGHPLFETVREELLEAVRGDMERGAVFYDVHRSVPARLAVYSAAIRDGLGHELHRRLFIVQEEIEGTLAVRQRAPAVYQDPERFLERTFLTKGLTSLAAEVLRRLSGEKTETSAVFNMTTQFGGGKTHALTLLYHLANNSPKAKDWQGVPRLLQVAGLNAVPAAKVAVFVGTEFDPIAGRGGADGTPNRKTPWGEIAFQIGGASALSILAEHEKQMVAPGGDVIRAFLPKERPVLILMDELMNFVSRSRKSGMASQLYSFLHNLSEEARGRDNMVLAVSVPASELEMSADDQSDYERFKKLLDRVGKAVIMSAESETSEIIRRRLFEWDENAVTADGRVLLKRDAIGTCNEFGDWVKDHRQQVPEQFNFDGAREAFAATYPFHPCVLSVFERKWQGLPRFQQTRGILRLLALWVSHAFQDGFKGDHRDPLIGLGTAPLDDPQF